MPCCSRCVRVHAERRGVWRFGRTRQQHSRWPPFIVPYPASSFSCTLACPRHHSHQILQALFSDQIVVLLHPSSHAPISDHCSIFGIRLSFFFRSFSPAGQTQEPLEGDSGGLDIYTLARRPAHPDFFFVRSDSPILQPPTKPKCSANMIGPLPRLLARTKKK
jgi:hypothetical protein